MDALAPLVYRFLGLATTTTYDVFTVGLLQDCQFAVMVYEDPAFLAVEDLRP